MLAGRRALSINPQPAMAARNAVAPLEQRLQPGMARQNAVHRGKVLEEVHGMEDT